jgi:hypothetical protein
MNNPLKKLSYRKIKPSEIESGRFKVNHNDLRILDEDDSSLQLEVYEKKQDELVVIESSLNANECVLIGSECRPNDIENWKKSDIMYLFASTLPNSEDRCYAYEIKQHVGNSEETIFDMLEQCASTSFFAKQLYEKACYGESRQSNLFTYVGVVTESFNRDELKHDWIEPRQRRLIPADVHDFVQQKMLTQQTEDEKKLLILQDFFDGFAVINGNKMLFDIRYFAEKRHLMRFVHGVLQK